jgi:hypothetical protein
VPSPPKQRLAELADVAHDLARADLARAEYDALVDQLAGGVGLGGGRGAAGLETIERLRKAVSARIRDPSDASNPSAPPSGDTSTTPSARASTASTGQTRPPSGSAGPEPVVDAGSQTGVALATGTPNV